MATIVFISTQKTGSSREALEIAKILGYKTVLLTNRVSHFKYRKEFTCVDEMYLCDIDNISELKQRIKQINDVIGIISFIDPYVYNASILAEELNLFGFTSQAIKNMLNKKLSRECIKHTPYAPWYKVITTFREINEEEIKKKLPLVIKSPLSTGSRDVYIVNRIDEFYNRIDYLLFGCNCKEILVEKYLEGPQYLIETLIKDEKVYIIAIIEQEVYLYNGHSIIIGYSLKHNLNNDLLKSLHKAVEDIIRLHGMKNGACHLEMRFVNNNWKLIEINPRISGGAMNEIIRYGLGINLVQETLNLIINQQINLTPKFNMYINTQYLISSFSGKLLKVTGRNEALNSKGVIRVFIKPRRGQNIYPPYSMNCRYAYVIASGLSEQDARVNAKRALNHIKLHVFKV